MEFLFRLLDTLNGPIQCEAFFPLRHRIKCRVILCLPVVRLACLLQCRLSFLHVPIVNCHSVIAYSFLISYEI